MNQEKFDLNVQKKYGVNGETLKDLSVSKIKNLRNINKEKLKEDKDFKLIRNISSTLTKGASIGAGVAGTINTAFPNIIPVAMSAFTTQSNMSTFGKILAYAGAASKPVATISGPTIIGIGAGIGAIIYGSYKLIKTGYNHLCVVNDKRTANKLYKNRV